VEGIPSDQGAVSDPTIGRLVRVNQARQLADGDAVQDHDGVSLVEHAARASELEYTCGLRTDDGRARPVANRVVKTDSWSGMRGRRVRFMRVISPFTFLSSFPHSHL
jgi:hypothetical protein